MSSLSKLKPTPIKKLRERIDRDDSMTGSNNFGNELKFDDGKTTKIKLFPPHPDSDDFYVLEKKHWLTIEKENGEAGRTTVLNSIVHGGTKKDIIDEYIAFAKKHVKDADKLKLITDWKTGLQGKNSWMAYALKITADERKFGLISLPKSVRDDINKKAQIEDEDEPIEIDPFTDPKEGLPLLVKYLSKPNKKKGEDYYSTEVGKKPVALTEEEADTFLAAKPLGEIYNNVYTIRDFDKALAGLQYFDTENELDIMDNEDFLEIIEVVKAQYDGSEEEEEENTKSKKKTTPVDKKKASKKVEVEEEEEEEEEEEKPKKKAVKKAVVEEEEEEETEEETEEEEEETEETTEGDEYDDMDRTELKRFIVKNKLDLVVKTSDSDDQIRDKIREALNTEEEETEEEEEETEEEEVEEAPKAKKKASKKVEVEEEEEEEEEEEKPAPKKKMTMDDIKAKIAAKNKDKK